MNTGEYELAVKQISDRVYRFILKNLGSRDDARDIVQEAFIKLWENRSMVVQEKAKSWLFTTAYRMMINFIKKHNKMVKMDDMTTLNGFTHEPAQQYDIKDTIDKAVAKLPVIQKTILLLRDLEGYNYNEIGEILSLGESQVKVYLFRARLKVKNSIMNLYKTA